MYSNYGKCKVIAICSVTKIVIHPSPSIFVMNILTKTNESSNIL